MQIWVDADACPKPIKAIIIKAAERLKLPVCFVANRYQQLPRSSLVRMVQVDYGADVADSYILAHASSGDLVVTQDIPLAAELIEANIHAMNPRGELYTADNVRERLGIRDFAESLRGAGVHTGGPPPLNERDKQSFANSFDRLLTKLKDS